MQGPLTTAILTICMTGATMFPSSNEVKKLIDQKLLEQADAVEMVRIDGKIAYMEYKKRETAPDSYAPASAAYTVTPLAAVPFGEGSTPDGRFTRKDNGHCGLIVDLADKDRLLNILPFHKVMIEAAASGRWEVALADYARYRAGDNISLGPLPDSGTAVFDLAAAFRQADLRRAKYLVFLLKSRQGKLDLKKITFSRDVQPVHQPLNGIWLWDSAKVPGHEERVLADLAARGLKRVYLQVGNNLESLLPFLRQAKKGGIEVFALDGSPEHVLEPSPLLKRVRAVAAFNRNHADAPFAGFQFDVEPYTRKDFNLRRDYYSEKYLALIASLREVSDSHFRLSAVIPFWYDNVPYGGSDLARLVTGMVDEVVVMSYRTSYAAIMEMATDELAYGERMGKPVYLGLEITRLEDEEHTVLQREQGKRGRDNWRESGTYRVIGSDLSFFGRMAELPAVMAERPPFASFAGWVIHCYEGLDSRPW